MMLKLLSFLNEMGFESIEIDVYNYLLKNKYGTISRIKGKLNYSYSQVKQALLKLEKKKIVDSSLESNRKTYIIVNPKIALKELVNQKLSNFKQSIDRLDEELKIQESKFGRCLKDITFYHYSNLQLAINNYHDLFERTQKEIVMTSLPISLLKKIEVSLHNAFMRGVQIKIFFSLSDFEEYPNYFEELTDILRRIRVEIIQTLQKTCQVIRFNDEIVNMGCILLDENYLNSLIFKEDIVFHCDGFLGPFAKQAKNYLEVLEVLKRMEIKYPEPIRNIFTVIEQNKSIKTRDISSRSKIGGAKLREILEFLINEGVIQEEIIKSEKAGRPKRVYSIIEEP